MCSQSGKFLLHFRALGWGPEKSNMWCTARYIDHYEEDGESRFLVLEKADFSSISHGPMWFYLFDFPEDLEPGFGELVESEYFLSGVFSN